MTTFVTFLMYIDTVMYITRDSMVDIKEIEIVRHFIKSEILYFNTCLTIRLI